VIGHGHLLVQPNNEAQASLRSAVARQDERDREKARAKLASKEKELKARMEAEIAARIEGGML
jgi:hypothetical protein